MQEVTLQNSPATLLHLSSKEISAPEGKEKGFGEVLKTSLQEVNRLHTEADQAIRDLAAGRGEGIHETMIALEKAEISFQLMMQVRNKIIGAYEEIMRMI